MFALLFIQQAADPSAEDLVSQIFDAVAAHNWLALVSLAITLAVVVGRVVAKRKAAQKAEAAGAQAVESKPAGGASDIVGLKK